MPPQNNGTQLNELPTEVLSNIFVSCLPHHNNKPSCSAAPLSLAPICKTWKEISNTSPRLWAGIELDNSTIRNGKRLSPATLFNQLGRWIKKSGNVPISIKI
ncbi:hypothetical protein DFH11DRAFT_1707435, partial [Phellopilus nigrolimitatus]